MPALAEFYSRTRGARKIIVVDLGFLGDTVHLVPALWEIKSNYPQAVLHVLTSPVGAEVLRLVPCADRAWAIEMDPGRRTLRQQWRAVRALRREQFDIAFNFSGADRTVFMTALTGARFRVSHAAGRSHFWNSWLIPEWAPRPEPNQVVFEQRRQVLAACGLKLGSARFDLKVDDASTAWAAANVPKGALHLSVNSAKATREWPIEQHLAFFREVWRDLPEARFVASCAPKPRELERLRALLAGARDPRLQMLPENLTIPQLAAVLARSRLHLGPDSGVLHLAVALEVPTISFFREQGFYRSFIPVGPAHRVISVPCHCIDNRNAPCESLGYSECFARIAPAKVAQLLREQLRSRPCSESGL